MDKYILTRATVYGPSGRAGLLLAIATDTIDSEIFRKICKVFGYFLSYRLKGPSNHRKEALHWKIAKS